MDDLILFGGHCDLYIMVQRFCLISLTISDRKISYRSLKQTAGSTSCQWTTILLFVELLYLSRKVRFICLIILQSLTSYQQFFPDWPRRSQAKNCCFRMRILHLSFFIVEILKLFGAIHMVLGKILLNLSDL